MDASGTGGREDSGGDRRRCFVGLGSNEGDREGHLREAVEMIAALPDTEVVRLSSLYDTDPVGDPSVSAYLNAVACLETGLPAGQLLWNLLRIESRLGRGQGKRSGPRTIDLDLLFYDRMVIAEEGLEVPHPRIAERLFVLVPMAEIEPGWLDPRTGLRMDELLRGRSHLERVRWAGRFTV